MVTLVCLFSACGCSTPAAHTESLDASLAARRFEVFQVSDRLSPGDHYELAFTDLEAAIGTSGPQHITVYGRPLDLERLEGLLNFGMEYAGRLRLGQVSYLLVYSADSYGVSTASVSGNEGEGSVVVIEWRDGEFVVRRVTPWAG